MPKYTFKILPELGWAALVAAVVAAGELLIITEPAAVDNWETWAVTGLAGIARASVAAVVAYFSARQIT